MFAKSEIRQNLLGCLEVALFMPRGVSRFAATSSAMKKSFLIQLLALPLTCFIVIAAHPFGDLSAGEAQTLIFIHCARVAVSLGLYLSLIYLMARSMEKPESFYRFATAHNWLLLPATLVALPLLASFIAGYHSWTDIYPMLIVITLYSYACTAFIAAHVMRIPWELAGFVSICGMAIHQESLHVLKWAAVNTAYFIS